MKIDNEAIIKAYNNGQSMNSIARAFGTYPTTVKRILEKNNVVLRHDVVKKGDFMVQNGEKLIEWAKAQDRLVTKAELAKIIGRTRLSPSYFIKYPELGQYIETYNQKDLKPLNEKLYDWLKENNISYKPKDRTKLKMSVDALLLGEYKGLAIQISEKPIYVSNKKHLQKMNEILNRGLKAGITVVFLNKEHFDNLEDVKIVLDDLKTN